MRNSLILLPLLLSTTPSFAQAPGVQPDAAQIQRVLADPAMADKLANVMQALSKSFLDLPVGEVQAAIEGRQLTPAEKRMTLGDMARRDDPNFDRNFQQRMAQTGPMIHQSMKTLSTALPEMMQGLRQASKALERAATNMPDPTYPKR